MATNSNALIVPGTGLLLVSALTSGAAPAKPTDPESVTPGGAWESYGHTSTDGLEITPDGGDVTTLATWISNAARTSTAPVSFSVSFTALQVDNLALTSYYGGGDITDEDEFGVPKQAGSIDKSLYIRMIDGTETLDIWLYKVSLKQNGAQSYTPEGLATVPLIATIVDDSTKADLFRYYKTGLGTP